MKGLIVELRPLHKDWDKKTQIGQFNISLLFWSYLELEVDFWCDFSWDGN
jgi:hypothetical protein